MLSFISHLLLVVSSIAGKTIKEGIYSESKLFEVGERSQPRNKRSQTPKMLAARNGTMSQKGSTENVSSTPGFTLTAEEKMGVMEALDHIHVLRQYQQMGSCSVCKKISVKKCGGCGTFYCSNECQTFDWAKHQAICPDQRDSVSERSSFSSSRRRRGGSFAKQFNGEPLMTADRASPFSSLANQYSKKYGNTNCGKKFVSNLRQNKQNQNQNPNQHQNQNQDSWKMPPNNDRKRNYSPKKGPRRSFTDEREEDFGNRNGESSGQRRVFENIDNRNDYRNGEFSGQRRAFENNENRNGESSGQRRAFENNDNRNDHRNGEYSGQRRFDNREDRNDHWNGESSGQRRAFDNNEHRNDHRNGEFSNQRRNFENNENRKDHRNDESSGQRRTFENNENRNDHRNGESSGQGRDFDNNENRNNHRNGESSGQRRAFENNDNRNDHRNGESSGQRRAFENNDNRNDHRNGESSGQRRAFENNDNRNDHRNGESSGQRRFENRENRNDHRNTESSGQGRDFENNENRNDHRNGEFSAQRRFENRENRNDHKNAESSGQRRAFENNDNRYDHRNGESSNQRRGFESNENRNDHTNDESSSHRRGLDNTENVTKTNKGVRKSWTKPEPMEVVAVFRESPTRYWVMNSKNLEEYEEIEEALNKNCANYDSIEPSVGLRCGCLYADEWYRAEIVSLTPEVVVHFIDYGNSTKYELNVFKKLPLAVASVPKLAFLVQFDHTTPEGYRIRDLESLKMLIQETGKAFDGTPIVKILRGLYGTGGDKPTTSSDGKERFVMDVFNLETRGMLFFYPGYEGVIRYASLIPDNNKDASECMEKVLVGEITNSNPYEAKVGDCVVVSDKEGNDQRGRVICKLDPHYFVQLFDCGNVIATDKVYEMDKSLLGLMQLGVKVTIKEMIAQDMTRGLETCFFDTKEKLSDGKWLCTLKATEQKLIAHAIIEKPEPAVQWVPSYIEVKNGSTVELSSMSVPNFYVRSVDVGMEQLFLQVNLETMNYTPNVESFTTPPQPGELCCAKFKEDNCFYRAVILSEEYGKINVFFVDFGNQQITELEDIKPISDSLRRHAFFAVRVQLEDVSFGPFPNMVKEYLERLIADNTELTLTYSVSLKKGVTLREKLSGVVVNSFITKTRARSRDFETPPPSDEVFTDDDLRYMNVPSESHFDIAVLRVHEDEFRANLTFWGTLAKSQNYTYVNGNFSAKLRQYCTNVYVPHCPEFRELCLVNRGDTWYRALCLGNIDDIYKVFFVDFGDICEVPSDSIRKMVKEFLEPPVLAMNCTVVEWDKYKGNDKLITKLFEIVKKRENKIVRHVSLARFADDTFYFSIPSIDSFL